MKVIHNIKSAQSLFLDLKRRGKIIGLVPTMGALHQGHISLIRRAKKENDIVVVSIFVNPTQFAVTEDLEKYPRPFEKDIKICQKEGVDVIFAPLAVTMYPENYLTYITVEKLSDIMCGKFRFGHFRGVTTIVAKLFNIVWPDRAYFGLKDYQQTVIIKKMTSDLNFPVKIIVCSTVREKTGLALSSRNTYLSDSECKRALALSHSLLEVEKLIKYKKIKTAQDIVKKIKSDIKSFFDKIQYIEVRDAETLEKVERVKGKVVVAVAGFIGKTRMIDNVVVRC